MKDGKNSWEEADLKEYWRQIELRDRKAREVPEEIFSLDYHIYEMEDPEQNGIQIETEDQWGFLGVSFGGSKKAMKRFRKTAKEIYLYYGASAEDIRTRSDRYRKLVSWGQSSVYEPGCRIFVCRLTSSMTRTVSSE